MNISDSNALEMHAKHTFVVWFRNISRRPADRHTFPYHYHYPHS